MRKVRYPWGRYRERRSTANREGSAGVTFSVVANLWGGGLVSVKRSRDGHNGDRKYLEIINRIEGG